MSYLDTLFVRAKGTSTYLDVRADFTGVRIVGLIDGLYAPGDVRGDDDLVPGADGYLPAPNLPRERYIIAVPIEIAGDSRGERNDNLRALGTLLGGGGLVDLKRALATGSGESHEEHTANGRFITGLMWTVMNPNTGRTSLQFYNLDGAWWKPGTGWIRP